MAMGDTLQSKAKMTGQIAVTFAKGNVLSVVGLVLALIALPVAWVVSAGMARSDLEEAQSEITGVERELRGVEVTYSIPSLEPGGEDFTLSSPPHPAVTDAVAAQRRLAKEQAERIEAATVARNRGEKELLVSGLFPEPAGQTGPSGAIALRTRMIQEVWPEAHDALLEEVGAGMPPDEGELRRELAAQRDRLTEERRRLSARDQLTDEDIEAIRDELRGIRLDTYRTAASGLTFYADREVFETMRGYDPAVIQPSIGTGEYLELFWRWQHTYWVESDLLKGLEKANRGLGVLNGAVKRVLDVTVEPLSFSPAGGGAGGVGSGGADYSVSFTGRRGGNGFYEVRYATVELLVDAGQLEWLVNGLAEQNFMTVLDWDYRLMAPGSGLSEGYDYGDAQIAWMRMQVETVWVRTWYDRWIPPMVRERMGLDPLPEEEPAADAGGGADGG